MKKYEILLWDVDGTLLDFDTAEKEGLKVVFREYGLTPTEDLSRQYDKINKALWDAYEEGSVSRAQVVDTRFATFFAGQGICVDGKKAEKLYRKQLNESAILIQNALEICASLSKRYDMYIVTNGVSETQYNRLSISGLDQYFKEIFVSEDAGSQKPQREFFDYCFTRIPDADAGKMLLIGDSLSSDMKGGNVAGIDTCWYNPGGVINDKGILIQYEIKLLEELNLFL